MSIERHVGDSGDVTVQRSDENDYEFGRRIGYLGDIIQTHILWRFYTGDFRNGYRKGNADINALMEDVSESRCLGC